MDNLKWRGLVRFVGLVDGVSSLILTLLVVSFGLAFQEGFQQHNKDLQHLADKPQFKDITDVIWICIFILLVILAFTCLFLLCKSVALRLSTEKIVDLKTAVKGAVAWRNDMIRFLLVITVLFCLIVWKFDVDPNIVLTMVVIICMRVIFLFVVCRFVKELKKCMASGTPQTTALANVTVVDNKINKGTKFATISV